jgi:hypothetical protein
MTSHLLSQNDLLLINIMKFYDTGNNMTTMLSIVNGVSNVSLRIIDWFTTNYAKKNNTSFIVNGKRFKVYDSYKLKLKSYKKSRFDPFCRWDRIQIPIENNTRCIETTVGQLNFFKWAIENDVVCYIKNNYMTIEEDMNNNNSLSKSKKHLLSNTRKKREELSISSNRYLNREYISTTFDFNKDIPNLPQTDNAITLFFMILANIN